MSKLDRPLAPACDRAPILRCAAVRTSTYSASSPLGQAVGSGDDLVLLAPDVDHRARVLAVDDRIARLDARRHHVALQQEGGVLTAVVRLLWCGCCGAGGGADGAGTTGVMRWIGAAAGGGAGVVLLLEAAVVRRRAVASRRCAASGAPAMSSGAPCLWLLMHPRARPQEMHRRPSLAEAPRATGRVPRATPNREQHFSSAIV